MNTLFFINVSFTVEKIGKLSDVSILKENCLEL